MGGGAWPPLVGGVFCLVNLVHGQDLIWLSSYTQLRFSGNLFQRLRAPSTRKLETITGL